MGSGSMNKIKIFFYSISLERISNKIRYLFKRIYNPIKYFIQRGRKGYSDFDLMDIDTYLLELIPNILRDFKNKKDSCPSQLTEQTWNDIIEEIIYCFKNANESITNFENPYLDDYYEYIIKPWVKEKFDITLNCTSKEQNFVVVDANIPEEYKNLEKNYNNSEKEKEKYIQKNLEKGFELLLKYFHYLWY